MHIDPSAAPTAAGPVVASCVIYRICTKMIVHSKQRRRFRRGTLLGWLGESVHPEVEHLEAEPIQPLPVVCRFHLCRNPAGGCGIGCTGGTGGAGTSIAEKAGERGGRPAGWCRCIMVSAVEAAEDETVAETRLGNSRGVSRFNS